ncbi:MAG: UDP-N-acetylmuramate--L-alanine ligase [Bacillota bacterium]
MKNSNHVHFIGIGGISMSGIAEILVQKGLTITGSDLHKSHLTEALKEKGVKIYIGHDAKNVKGADTVVITSAIPASNPELIYARKNNIPIMKRAQVIASLMEEQRGIAISGTHGKTTTTSMISTIFLKGSQDPTILIGGELDLINGNSYQGKGEYLITEADESDGSLLYFDPEIVVVTNIEMDHQDYYLSEKKLFKTFKNFLSKIPQNGKAVVCAEDKTLINLVDEKDARVFTYGIDKGDLRAENYNLYPFGSIYDLVYKGNKLTEINLQIPGKHNMLNSLASIAVALSVGLDITEIKKGIESYIGVHRRFEKKGLLGDILIVDDYAHHPTEVEATLKAAKNTGYERIIAIFQPHRYTRTKHLMNEFNNSFNLVDHLIITDIYSAGEKPIPGVEAEELARNIAVKNSFQVVYVAELEDVVGYLRKIIKSKDLVLTIGAGNVYKVGEMLLEKMKNYREMA